MKKILLGFTLLVFFITGCGYSASSLLPSHIKKIYVKPFANKIDLTTEVPSEVYRYRANYPQIEVLITKEVVDKYLKDGNLKVVNTPEEADIILEGMLYDYLRQPTRYGDDRTVQEYRLSLVTQLKMYDTKKQEVMWTESRLIGDSDYSLSGRFAKTEAVAIEEAAKDLARRIVERTVEGW
jgi:hypothetical protein